ncbi:Aminopeptidase P2 [Glycine max]|nr:Aminopeptidase P2 [Glycine max]
MGWVRWVVHECELMITYVPIQCCCIAEFLGSAIATPSAIAAAMGAVSWSPHASGILLPSSTIKLVDLSLLSAAEIDWLNNYHSLVWEKVSPLLDGSARQWLWNNTLPIVHEKI